MSTGPAITTRALTRRFGNTIAVDHVDLQIPRAQIFGFLGPNGSGKSTTIRMMCGLLKPTEGSVEVLGLQLPRKAEQLRKRIGYMTQHFSLYGDMTIRENLEFIADIHTLPRTNRLSRINTLMERYGLADKKDRRADTLSGGEKQHLSLAAAVIHKPELLFLDEPTSAVDPQSRRLFWQNLFELVDKGTTIIVSTHLMDEAERCHDLGILNHGRLVANDSPQRLMGGIRETVILVKPDEPHLARLALISEPEILSLTQLGASFRLMIEPDVEDPEALVTRILKQKSIAATINKVVPNLEDVFVASTELRK